MSIVTPFGLPPAMEGSSEGAADIAPSTYFGEAARTLFHQRCQMMNRHAKIVSASKKDPISSTYFVNNRDSDGRSSSTGRSKGRTITTTSTKLPPLDTKFRSQSEKYASGNHQYCEIPPFPPLMRCESEGYSSTPFTPISSRNCFLTANSDLSENVHLVPISTLSLSPLHNLGRSKNMSSREHLHKHSTSLDSAIEVRKEGEKDRERGRGDSTEEVTTSGSLEPCDRIGSFDDLSGFNDMSCFIEYSQVIKRSDSITWF